MNLSVGYTGDVGYTDSYYELMKVFMTAKQEGISQITLNINSEGGDFDLGMSIVDAIDICKNSGISVNTVAVGKVQSIAFLIFCAGTKRYSFKRTSFLYHSPSLEIINETIKVENFSSVTLSMQRGNVIITDILKEKVKKSEWKKFQTNILEKGAIDHYLTVDQMKQYGLVTDIVNKWSDICE